VVAAGIAEREIGTALPVGGVKARRALPPGWAGKACALDRCVRDDLVLFLDADTLPRPELARAGSGVQLGPDVRSRRLGRSLWVRCDMAGFGAGPLTP
jgi:hypothetical protein